MENERRFITAGEAESLLQDGQYIHTFANPAGMLIGADWGRQKIIDLFKEHDGKIEIGGDVCRRMGHGLIVHRGDRPLFIECDKEKLNEFDPPTEPTDKQIERMNEQ